MPTYIVVRTTIADPAQRAAFDTWYAQEHLPDAVKAFGAQKAWRFWSETDPAVHQAHEGAGAIRFSLLRPTTNPTYA
jgi:hypothetical protein